MMTKDKEILHAILNYIGSNNELEDNFAKYVGELGFEMTPDEFSDWLCKVKVLD